MLPLREWRPLAAAVHAPPDAAAEGDNEDSQDGAAGGSAVKAGRGLSCRRRGDCGLQGGDASGRGGIGVARPEGG